MNITKNQSGAIGIVEIILVLILIAASVFVAIQVTKSDEAVNDTEQAASEAGSDVVKQTNKEESNILEIPELGIQIDLSDSDLNLAYMVDPDLDSSVFIYDEDFAKEAAKAGYSTKEDDCKKIWAITTYTKKEADDLGTEGPITKDNLTVLGDDLFYLTQGSQSFCGEPDKVTGFEEKETKLRDNIAKALEGKISELSE